jgi:hypothetical protein
MNLNCYSQKIILDIKKDTTICFSVNQSKHILKKIYEVDKWKSLDSICEAQLNYCDTLLEINKDIIQRNEFIIDNNNQMLSLKDTQINNLNNDIDSLKDDIDELTIKKKIVGALGMLGTLTFFILFIVK